MEYSPIFTEVFVMEFLNNDIYEVKIENGTVREFYRKTEPWNLVSASGATGSVIYTLENEDIFLNAPSCSPYVEHLSSEEPADDTDISYSLDNFGLHIRARSGSKRVSQFGIRIDGNFISGPGTPFEHQFLPCSPYTACEGYVCYCIFSSPDGRYMVVLSENYSDGWKLHYSSEGFGHIIEGFSVLSSFDRRYGGSGKKDTAILLTVADSLPQAFEIIGRFYGLPYVNPILSGSFGNGAAVSVSEDTDLIEISRPDGSVIRTLNVTSPSVPIPMELYGFYKVTPVSGGKRGIPAVLWNGQNMDICFMKAEKAISEPYHVDYNLCEGGFWTWSLLRYALLYGEKIKESELLSDLETIMGRKKPYLQRRSIVPFAQDNYSPVHIYQSDRIQEQFVGVSILLDAHRLYGKDEYLDYAVMALDELIQNWITDEGEVRRGGVDYTTVTCPVITVTDMALALKEKNPDLSEKYSKTAIKIADHVLTRGFSFPTEGQQNALEMEDGSISCSALTVLYVYYHLCRKPEYTDFAGKVLSVHNSWRINSPDARMYGSSMRWWETIWEGDGTGPNICAGHAWTIWRSEALFYLGILTGDGEALLDSWNGFITNFAKEDENGNMYSCYVPDYICGGGMDDIRCDLFTKDIISRVDRYRVAHGYPSTPDCSLSRYVWVRSIDTWMKTAAVIEVSDTVLFIRCHSEGNRIIPDSNVQRIYMSPSLTERFTSDIPITELAGKE